MITTTTCWIFPPPKSADAGTFGFVGTGVGVAPTAVGVAEAGELPPGGEYGIGVLLPAARGAGPLEPIVAPPSQPAVSAQRTTQAKEIRSFTIVRPYHKGVLTKT
jgi:hypothetical protein